ncbi:DUF3545 family protein [Vibrio aquaticus]|uniref:DUF3545 family protein n=1 Tax=Vibrio aquaticus TaxID=2496559 RepID=A0A432CZ05_9VIBR|nr:DUF3545 family protein [Vibrio aquaticus]RTZ16049.1 DUF3545 family protein [Vibrio aquaticus]
MEGLNFEEIFEQDLPKGRGGRSKPVKRKWREIEAIKDRQRLQKELMDMDIGFDDSHGVEY